MKNKRIKIFPIIMAFTCSGLGFKYSLDKKKNIKNNTKTIEFVGPLQTTYTTTYITTTTTTTTENIYKDIMFLYDKTYEPKEINEMIIKYSNYSDITYNQAINILKDNYKNHNNYKTLENYIMSGLFDYAEEQELISSTCDFQNIKTKELSSDEKEQLIIDMCNVMEISNDDKKIILAIFRWETGYGKSELCQNYNNYGGIKVGNNFGVYQTPEFGIYKAIKCIYSHIETSKEKGYTDINSIVNDISYRYCYDTANDWAYSINNMIYNINEYYQFNKKN